MTQSGLLRQIGKMFFPRQQLLAVSMDPIIHIDRSRHLVYSDFFATKVEVVHPELEASRPTKYDIRKVEIYFHDEQKENGDIRGRELHEHLKKTKGLQNCLSLADALAIQERGIKFFNRFDETFGEWTCWGSVVRDRCNDLWVPTINGQDGDVEVLWESLDADWDYFAGAACFPS